MDAAYLSAVLLDSLLECDRVGTDNIRHLFSVLEDVERWHGAHAKLLGDIWRFVDIELEELDVRILV